MQHGTQDGMVGPSSVHLAVSHGGGTVYLTLHIPHLPAVPHAGRRSHLIVAHCGVQEDENLSFALKQH